jgi:hypothetical protein
MKITLCEPQNQRTLLNATCTQNDGTECAYMAAHWILVEERLWVIKGLPEGWPL